MWLGTSICVFTSILQDFVVREKSWRILIGAAKASILVFELRRSTILNLCRSEISLSPASRSSAQRLEPL
jgi:hypothetical protein